MIEWLRNIIDIFVNALMHIGPIGGVLLIFLESILPVLPLCVFISFNISAFGLLFGIILSYIGTILGCIVSYFAFNKFGELFKKTNKKEKVIKMKARLSSISVPSLAVLMALPFTPAFVVNISAGLSNMKFKKFLISILIGKIPMILFWSFIGKSLTESLTDYKVLIKIAVMLIITYIFSKIINKFIKVED